MKVFLGLTVIAVLLAGLASGTPALALDSLYSQQTASEWYYAESFLARNDANIDTRAADDFTLAQSASIQSVVVHGDLNSMSRSGLWPPSVVVTFWSDNGQSDSDLQLPDTVLKSIEVPWSNCSYSDSKLLNVDFGSSSGDWFQASAGTKYWLSVQPKMYDTGWGDSFHWFYANDGSHPSAYAPVGSAAAQFSGSWTGQHYGRYWKEDWLNGDRWITEAYSGTLPSGWNSGQRLDLSFELLGAATGPAYVSWKGGTGNWTDANWDGTAAYPLASDDTVVSTGKVIVNSNEAAKSLTVSDGAEVDIVGSLAVTSAVLLDGATSGGKLVSGGELTAASVTVRNGLLEVTSPNGLPAGAPLTIGAGAASAAGSAVTAVPEPGTMLLFATGAALVAIGTAWRRRQGIAGK
jgi:hypothetical protein